MEPLGKFTRLEATNYRQKLFSQRRYQTARAVALLSGSVMDTLRSCPIKDILTLTERYETQH